MEDIEGLTEALRTLQEALSKVQEMLPSDGSEEQTANFNESTAEMSPEGVDETEVKPSALDEDPDVRKLAAVAALQKHLG